MELHIDQWNWIESPETNPRIYDQVISVTEGKTIHIVFSKNGAGKTTATCKKLKLEHFLTP